MIHKKKVWYGHGISTHGTILPSPRFTSRSYQAPSLSPSASQHDGRGNNNAKIKKNRLYAFAKERWRWQVLLALKEYQDAHKFVCLALQLRKSPVTENLKERIQQEMANPPAEPFCAMEEDKDTWPARSIFFMDPFQCSFFFQRKGCGYDYTTVYSFSKNNSFSLRSVKTI